VEALADEEPLGGVDQLGARLLAPLRPGGCCSHTASINIPSVSESRRRSRHPATCDLRPAVYFATAFR
jgi:hypothetical protein